MSEQCEIPPADKSLLIGGEFDGLFVANVKAGCSLLFGNQRYESQKLILAKIIDGTVYRCMIRLLVAEGIVVEEDPVESELMEKIHVYAEQLLAEQPERFVLKPMAGMRT